MTAHTKQQSVNPNLAGMDPTHPLHAWQHPSWIQEDLQKMADDLKEGDVLGEVGVGSGAYARTLAARGVARITLDLPFQPASARTTEWPLKDESVDLLICFDALQFVQDVQEFLRNVARVTRTTQLFVLVIKDREDLEVDGLKLYFPQAVEAAKPLSPEVPVLEKLLEEEGLHVVRRAKLGGERGVDRDVLQAIARREMVGLSTLTQDEFDSGILRLKDAVTSGTVTWPAQYTVLVARKVRPWQPQVGHAAPQAGGMM